MKKEILTKQKANGIKPDVIKSVFGGNEKGKQFVGNYPLMFTEDKEWWGQELDRYFLPRWTNIKDGLPPNNRAVLVTGENLSMDIGWRSDGKNYGWCKFNGGELFESWQKITHWMYLPNPPKTVL